MIQLKHESTIGGVVQPLFATPLYINKLSRPFFENEHKCFGDVLQRMRHNTGNLVSLNNQVLNDERLSDLKNWIHLCIDDYFKLVVCPLDDVEPYITISWINCTMNGQYHHQHNHPNSIISGVFYIDVDEDTDTISFYRDAYNTINFHPSKDDVNLYNAGLWKMSVQRGLLLLFPSSLRHSVSTVSTDMNRISLSFNVFVKGVVGDVIDKTFLELGN